MALALLPFTENISLMAENWSANRTLKSRDTIIEALSKKLDALDENFKGLSVEQKIQRILPEDAVKELNELYPGCYPKSNANTNDETSETLIKKTDTTDEGLPTSDKLSNAIIIYTQPN